MGVRIEPSGDRAERLFAVLVPAFSVIASGGDPDTAAATASGGRIAFRSYPAARAGVRAGQPLREATRLCPELALFPQDSARDARLFEPVVRALEGAAVGVEVVRPGLCLLRTAGPARYYGGELEAAGVLRDAVADAPVDLDVEELGAGVGAGAGELAATLAACRDAIIPPGRSPAFLAGFGIGVLDQPQLAGTLARLGITTLGELAKLPAAAVADRFGTPGVLAHRRASGLDARPPAPRAAPVDLAETVELDPPVVSTDQLAFAAKAAADRLHVRLAAHGLVCDRVEIAVETVFGRVSARWWRHGGALSSLAVAERSRWQTDPLTSATDDEDAELDGFSQLTLRPDGLRTAAGRQLGLLGPEELPDVAAAALERLQVLLGHGAVRRPRMLGGRDPGDRIALVPVGDLGPEQVADGPWPGRIPDPPPAVVLAAPAPAELLDDAGRPVRISGRGALSAAPATLALGGSSYRITGHSLPWLAEEQPWAPGAARRRARMQVTTADGAAYLVALASSAWILLAAYQ